MVLPTHLDWTPVPVDRSTFVFVPEGIEEDLIATPVPAGEHWVAALWVRLPRANLFHELPQAPLPPEPGLANTQPVVPIRPVMIAVTHGGLLVPVYPGGPSLR